MALALSSVAVAPPASGICPWHARQSDTCWPSRTLRLLGKQQPGELLILTLKKKERKKDARNRKKDLKPKDYGSLRRLDLFYFIFCSFFFSFFSFSLVFSARGFPLVLQVLKHHGWLDGRMN
jgi:hypothetical protein